MTTEEARVILGTVSQIMTNSQVDGLVANFTYLANTFLDNFERKTFNGSTLVELGTSING